MPEAQVLVERPETDMGQLGDRFGAGRDGRWQCLECPQLRDRPVNSVLGVFRTLLIDGAGLAALPLGLSRGRCPQRPVEVLHGFSPGLAPPEDLGLVSTVGLITGTANRDAVDILHQSYAVEAFKDAAIAGNGFEERVGLAVIAPALRNLCLQIGV